MQSVGYKKALNMMEQVRQQRAMYAPQTLPPHLRGKTRNAPRRLSPELIPGELKLGAISRKTRARKTRRNRRRTLRRRRN